MLPEFANVFAKDDVCLNRINRNNKKIYIYSITLHHYYIAGQTAGIPADNSTLEVD